MDQQVTVSRELLRQVLNYVEVGNPGHIADRINVLVALRAALEAEPAPPKHRRNQMKDHKLVPLRPPESILAVVRKAYGNATAYDVGHVWHEIYTRLPDAAPVQEPSHDVVAGAIFDFAGFLTSHKEMIEVGSCANASPMVERIKEWSSNRGLSLVNPDVFGWQMRAAQPRKADNCNWPTCQTEQYQKDLADQIAKELIGESRKAVKLTPFEIQDICVGEKLTLRDVTLCRAIEAAVLKANGVEE